MDAHWQADLAQRAVPGLRIWHFGGVFINPATVVGTGCMAVGNPARTVAPRQGAPAAPSELRPVEHVS